MDHLSLDELSQTNYQMNYPPLPTFIPDARSDSSTDSPILAFFSSVSIYSMHFLSVLDFSLLDQEAL